MNSKALRLTNEDNKGTVFERGTGAHYTSNIVYNLSDKDYMRVTSYVGMYR